MIFLTAEDIAEFNAEIVPHGRQEGSKVEAVANRVLNAYHYENVTDVYRLAALYLIAISHGHIFLMATNVRPSKAWRYFSVLMALHCGKTQNWSKLRLKQLKAASTLNKLLNTYAG
jgi:Prophage maintenance system killer protein